MVKRISTLIAFSLGLFAFSGCSKEDVIDDSEDILGTWAVVAISSNEAYDWDGDGRSETDIFGTYDFCQRDIQFIFDPNGYGESRQGCDGYWQQIYWQLSSNGRTLTIDMPGDDLNLDITQFASSTIRGEDHVYVNGRNYVITYTLARR
ncbi:MAG TPA: DUF5004 domain-containing protein [Flavisolibacter sp.]|nr:DUF5004 domain-containing protein [Flavisolibacter sp.]